MRKIGRIVSRIVRVLKLFTETVRSVQVLFAVIVELLKLFR